MDTGTLRARKMCFFVRAESSLPLAWYANAMGPTGVYRRCGRIGVSQDTGPAIVGGVYVRSAKDESEGIKRGAG